jgi:hypothetical protein
MYSRVSKKVDCVFNRLLWKLGAHRRKRVLKFFGKWTIEDDLAEILAEEIQQEINQELIERIKK